jgi:hypothetical protein
VALGYIGLKHPNHNKKNELVIRTRTKICGHMFCILLHHKNEFSLGLDRLNLSLMMESAFPRVLGWALPHLPLRLFPCSPSMGTMDLLQVGLFSHTAILFIKVNLHNLVPSFTYCFRHCYNEDS